MLFGMRNNFGSGYFTKEGELVAKYLKNIENVLVFGSGNGREARPIINKAKRIICFDYGLGYLLSGKKLCVSEEITNVYFLLADATNLPFSSASFDFIFFSIYCTLNEKRFDVLCDIRRILRQDGFLLLTCLLPWYPNAIQKGFVTFNNINEIEKEVTKYGFTFIEGGQDYNRKEYIFAILSHKSI